MRLKKNFQHLRPVEKRPFSQAEKMALMAAIGSSTNWVKDAKLSDFSAEYWVNTSNKCVAYVKSGIGEPQMLGVMTGECMSRSIKNRESKDKKKASGF